MILIIVHVLQLQAAFVFVGGLWVAEVVVGGELGLDLAFIPAFDTKNNDCDQDHTSTCAQDVK